MGAGALGCSSGTFVDSPVGNGGIETHLTCASGSGSGDTFVILFHPLFVGRPGPGDPNGPWTILGGTGGFATLHGTGDFSLRFTGPQSGDETFNGDIHFN